jgi:hypothetical protein
MAAVLPLAADPASKHRLAQRTAEGKHRYRAESPLPDGWPAPGPFDVATLKKYPAYRAAFTTTERPNGGFMTLFRHIQRHNIPMTAPVEMTLNPESKDSPDMEQMAFLYQNQEVGTIGAEGSDVEVRDVPAGEVISYTWQGSRSQVAKARAAVDAELARLGRTARSYRLLGYNSPFMPRTKQTHELQAVLEREGGTVPHRQP